ncbi:MAG: MFS transporter [Actinobacteria bacterium]|nr:MAG: MFS transporter [Actinomycetota bacterium]
MTTASLGFSLAGDIWALGLSRLFQGVGSSCSWAGGLAWVIASTPRERRGELLGTAMGAAVFGALLGPVLGALAGIVGIRAAFLGVTVAGVALAGWAAATPGVAPERQALRAGLLAMRERSLVVGLWLIVLPALLFGVLIVLVPLRLSQHGWGTIAIGALFLATTALEMVLNPLLGRLTDRRGRMRPVRAALLASILVSAALAWATEPGLIAPLVACWGIGALVGPAAGGALAGVAGDAVPYLVLAGVCVATYLATRARYAEPVGELP